MITESHSILMSFVSEVTINVVIVINVVFLSMLSSSSKHFLKFKLMVTFVLYSTYVKSIVVLNGELA
jgi:hypothetical protein